MAIAGLFKVRGPNGTYYAVFDPATGRMWTERSEQGARSQAGEAGLELAPERSITHEALMQLSGRDTRNRPRGPIAPSSPPPESPAPDAKPDRPIISRLPFAKFDPGEVVLTSQPAPTGGAPFSAETPVAPPSHGTVDDSETPAAGAVFNRDVLDEKMPLPKGKGKNPFADRKPRRKD